MSRMKTAGIVAFIIALVMFVCLPAFAGEEWKQAIGQRTWSFPRDHGAHPEFRTEWWYFTGNLRDGSGNRYGYQLTFFRQGVRLKPSDPGNPWSLRDLYPAHFAVTDVRNDKFHFAEQITRSGPGLSGAATNGMNVWNLGWSAKMKGDRILIRAHHGEMELALELKPRKPLILQGEKGLSRKGPGEGQASYYYSFTDLATRGTIRTPDTQMPVAVEGVSWFDQEFGSNVLSKDQVGWDWFSIHLSDGRDLMLFFLRKKDGTVEKESSGTLVEPDGKSRHLKRGEIQPGGPRDLEEPQKQRHLPQPLAGTHPRGGPRSPACAAHGGPGADHHGLHGRHLLGRRRGRKGLIVGKTGELRGLRGDDGLRGEFGRAFLVYLHFVLDCRQDAGCSSIRGDRLQVAGNRKGS